ENHLPGSSSWRVTTASDALWCYTDRAHAEPGEQIEIHAAAEAPVSASWELWRLGWYGGAGARLLDQGGPIAVPAATTAHLDPGLGTLTADWPTTFSVTIPANAVSGTYLIKLTAPGQQTYAPLVVGEPRGAGPVAPILVVVPFNTYQ